MTLEPGPGAEYDRVATRSLDALKPGGSGTVRRRDFLAWISALALVPSIEGIARGSVLDAGTGPASTTGELPIGYLEGSDSWDLSQIEQSLAGARVVPARELAGGDVEFALGNARCTVHGFYPNVPKPGTLDSIDFSVFFPSPEVDRPEELLRYFAWSFAENPVRNLGAPNRFDVPVGADGTLPLLVEALPLRKDLVSRRGLATAGWMPGVPQNLSLFANFTVDGDPLRPKLRCGAYLLALSAAPWPEATTLPDPEEGAAPELLSLLVTVEAAVPELEDGVEENPAGDTDPLPGDDPTPDGLCDSTNGDLVLATQNISSTRIESACRSIAASDYKVTETGTVTFESPSIALGDGFEVEGGFTAANRPT